MNVLALLSDKLKELGADGLCNDEDCGCGLDNLAPCESWIGGCVPARELSEEEKETLGISSEYSHYYEEMTLPTIAQKTGVE